VRIALKIVAALLFVLVTPRAAMGEIFEVVGTGAGAVQVDSAMSEFEGHGRPDLGEGDGPTKPRWAIPKRRQPGGLVGTPVSLPSPGAEPQGQPDPLLAATGAGAGAEPTPNRH
jgi:hypothetical protein